MGVWSNPSKPAVSEILRTACLSPKTMPRSPFPPLWCSVWTSTGLPRYVCISKCTKILLCDATARPALWAVDPVYLTKWPVRACLVYRKEEQQKICSVILHEKWLKTDLNMRLSGHHYVDVLFRSTNTLNNNNKKIPKNVRQTLFLFM